MVRFENTCSDFGGWFRRRWRIALAAAASAGALSAIFGVQHPTSVAIIMLSAALSAVLRRGLARVSANTLIRPFCAALVAGVVGAIAVHLQVSTSLRLIAVCPCMILVTGPHVLNGALDLLAARIQLGAARLTYAVLIIIAIRVELLLGLGLFGVSLPVDPPGSPVPVWLAAS